MNNKFFNCLLSWFT